MNSVQIVGRQPEYQVRQIGVVVRGSREYAKKGWRTIELSATADVAPGGDAALAHNDLYEQLRTRISLLLNENGRG